MDVQILSTYCAMDLTGLLYVPCPVTQITDIHYPWERRCDAEKNLMKLMYMGDLWFLYKLYAFFTNVGDCVVEFVSYG